MQIVVYGTETQRDELFTAGCAEPVQVTWVFEKVDLLHYKTADVIIDLQYENTLVSNALLQQMSGLKIINSVVDTLAETDTAFVRINGWSTFLKNSIIEASCRHEDLKKLAEVVFSWFGKTLVWLPDEPGFVVPRVVSLIVNEAYFALSEGVSTRAEIDIAMQLGTAYPFGPFEWSETIGLKNIVALLQRLRTGQPRYTPAPLLLQVAAI